MRSADVLTFAALETAPDGSQYAAISPTLLFPDTFGRCAVHLKKEWGFQLYAAAGERITEAHRRSLLEHGVRHVYISARDRDRFEAYVEDHLGARLGDPRLRQAEKAKAIHASCAAIIARVFQERLPAAGGEDLQARLRTVVEEGVAFLARPDALKTMAAFISHDYKTWSHCLQVFVYAVALLQTYDPPREELVAAGQGALLHDIGKLNIPLHILVKTGRLTDQERQTMQQHPLHGVSLCSHLALPGLALNVMLFHHERMDGKGYPAGMKGADIPLAVRAVTICDIYDAITSNRPYGRALRPYRALAVMQNEMRGAIDLEVFRRFIGVLANAEIL